VGDCEIVLLLEALQSTNARESWETFLRLYSPVLYHTAQTCSSTEDDAADCYLYICEQLARARFRRLLKFDPKGSASFTTWLRVVARNLCFDWHRTQSGRPRPFKSVQRLSPLEMQIYNCRFVRGASQEETMQTLRSSFPGVSPGELSQIEDQIQRSLSSRQQWILSTRKHTEPASAVAVAREDGEPVQLELVDPRPDPEAQCADRQQEEQLRRKLTSLPAEERLLVQLRFENDLSLEEIARLCGLGDAQRVHRRLAAILKKLRGAAR